MNTIIIDRAVVEQALKALEISPDVDPIFAGETILALRAALAQQAEALNLRDPAVQRRLAAQWGYVPVEQAEPDLSRCPQCNGPADNGHDRSIPPSPYLCTKCMAEPAQEPVAWNWMLDGLPYGRACYGDPPDADIAERAATAGRSVRLLYTDPPQRKPLTEEKIDRIHLHLSSTVGSSYKTVARAIEKASWEKNNGQA